MGGTVDHQRNWFCISRGAGRTDNDVTSSLYVSGGAAANLAQICLNNANGVSDYYGRSLSRAFVWPGAPITTRPSLTVKTA